MRQPRRSAPEQAAGDTDDGMRQLLVAIGSELTVITALLYYFGWVRTRVQAENLGFPSGVLNLSIADYLLKSVNVLFPLLTALLVLLIIGHVVFDVVLPRRWRVGISPSRLRRYARVAKGAAFGCAVLAVVGSLPPANNRYSLPAGLTMAVLLAIAARGLETRVLGRDPWTRPRRWMVTLLLLLLMFWNTERVALFLGEQFAADYKARPEQFPAIVLYSKDDLRIDADGVVAEPPVGEPGSYRYRYTGLRVMESVADRYVLINPEWTGGNGRVYVITHSDAIRVEFVGRDAG
ncbi:hypothetical protein O7635_24385 [Asanoa sp. WMMD1127]|uniref:hypothetical protein n=1 Tax=Asanoa sp. WMMD1127 TaxID=3016107 RepID=UPI0024170D46|nr:hypothetical protein [Asanoa sp. WMMD1127]MDG4824999.1 hypothetical protein [Asanoa sp. WMMD1127]